VPKALFELEGSRAANWEKKGTEKKKGVKRSSE